MGHTGSSRLFGGLTTLVRSATLSTALSVRLARTVDFRVASFVDGTVVRPGLGVPVVRDPRDAPPRGHRRRARSLDHGRAVLVRPGPVVHRGPVDGRRGVPPAGGPGPVAPQPSDLGRGPR